jgi:hypothetical protein
MTSIYVKEKAAQGTPTATYGQIWVKNTNPASFYIEDDVGVGAVVNMGALVVDNITVDGATVVSDTGTVGFGDDNLTTTGNITGNQLTGTLQTAAQTNITSVGTLTTLTVDNITVNGAAITSVTGAISFGDENLTTTGNITGNQLTGTLQTAAQTNITSLGTLTTLIVDNITINGAAITSDTGAISFGNENLTTTGGLASTNLLVTEGADHVNTPGAGKGEFWVRNDTPCVPVFTDDAGTDHVLTTAVATIPIIIDVTNETSTVVTGTGVRTFRMPFAFTLTEVRSSLTTASTSGLVTVDINETGTTILSTKLSIDANETTSETAATAAVISDSSLADGAEITIDIDAAGTGAEGLKVYLIGTAA